MTFDQCCEKYGYAKFGESRIWIRKRICKIFPGHDKPYPGYGWNFRASIAKYFIKMAYPSVSGRIRISYPYPYTGYVYGYAEEIGIKISILT